MHLAFPSRRHFIKSACYGAAGATGVLALLRFFHTNITSPPLVTYPNPVLRAISRPVDRIDDSIILVAQAMIKILRTRSMIDFFFKGSLCKGLSAPQIGVQQRLMVCGLQGQLKVIVNPVVIIKNGSYQNKEYCLSLPRHATCVVPRSGFIKIGYQDLQGRQKVLAASRQAAGLLQHEMDHLNGVLYIDYKNHLKTGTTKALT